MTDSTEFALNCFLPDKGFFVITIVKQAPVSKLRESVKAMVAPALNDFAFPALKLWKVSIPADDDAALSTFVPQNDEAQGVLFLKPLTRLDENFATEPVRDHIHIIVQRPLKSR